MRTTIVLILLFIVNIQFSSAQEIKGSVLCSQKKMNNPDAASFMGDSQNTPKHKFDVLNYTINLDIRNCFLSPYPRSFTGYVIVKFRVDSTLNSIDLNATNTSIVINSVSMAGSSFTHSSNIVTIILDRTYNPDEIAEVKIDYSHLNVSDGAFYVSNGGLFTDAEPEGARKWFPCWDKPFDKATIDLTVKVPANVKLGSNGRLNDSTLIGDTLYYNWVSKEPVATYLVVMTGKVNYNLNIVYWKKLSNPNDSIPIRFYFNNGENPNNIKNIIGDMTTYFSQKFGEHAFEKNGFATAPASGFNWGGMENQTLTTLCAGCWGANLISHEYAHQWFGDMITCGTWADIWLNEGFATYSEALWYEHTSGYSAYKNDILGEASSYLSGNPGWPMYNPSWIDNTPPNNVLFNYAITYAKGSCVLHMLRYVLQDTSLFFDVVRGYATDTAEFKFKNSVTDDFAAKISQVAGQDLTWFINQWVKEPNHPVYQNYYQFTTNGGNIWTVGFQARQTQTNTVFFKMPIELKISFSSGPDTLIRVMNDFNHQYWHWTFNRQPLSFQFDPGNDIVLKQGTTMPGIITGIINENEIPKAFLLYQNYPNPFNPESRIKYQIATECPVEIKVFDILGNDVKTLVNQVQKPGNYEVYFYGKDLSSGVYFYKITAGDFVDVKSMILLK
jgi:aminopeptidase N